MVHGAGRQRRGHSLGGRGGRGQLWLPGLSQGLGSGTPWASLTPHMAGPGASAQQSHRAGQGAQDTHVRGTEGHVVSGGRGVSLRLPTAKTHLQEPRSCAGRGGGRLSITQPPFGLRTSSPAPGPPVRHTRGHCQSPAPHASSSHSGEPSPEGTRIQTGRTEVSRHRRAHRVGLPGWPPPSGDTL